MTVVTTVAMPTFSGTSTVAVSDSKAGPCWGVTLRILSLLPPLEVETYRAPSGAEHRGAEPTVGALEAVDDDFAEEGAVRGELEDPQRHVP